MFGYAFTPPKPPRDKLKLCVWLAAHYYMIRFDGASRHRIVSRLLRRQASFRVPLLLRCAVCGDTVAWRPVGLVFVVGF